MAGDHFANWLLVATGQTGYIYIHIYLYTYCLDRTHSGTPGHKGWNSKDQPERPRHVQLLLSFLPSFLPHLLLGHRIGTSTSGRITSNISIINMCTARYIQNLARFIYTWGSKLRGNSTGKSRRGILPQQLHPSRRQRPIRWKYVQGNLLRFRVAILVTVARNEVSSFSARSELENGGSSSSSSSEGRGEGGAGKNWITPSVISTSNKK